MLSKNKISFDQIFIILKMDKNSKELESYKKVSLLGKGSFGKAFLVQCGSDGVGTICINCRAML